ncbi:MAG TPA: TrkA C-terminal domain-containing protein, partial [Spirochaetales bacterium]|nr:TrkA C-terminal domain-containing protein [Spirochaetales bacterium]
LAKAFITDVLNLEALAKIVPEGIDVAIVDVGSNLEVAILVTNSLKKLNVRQIIVRSDSDEHGEILGMVGATRIVYPAREAADKVVPMLVSQTLFNFMAISPSLVIAELKVPERYVGMTLVEANFRQAKGINVVAIRKEDNDEYRYFEPKYRLKDSDVLLCAATEDDMTAFTGARIAARHNVIADMLKGIFGNRKSQKPKNGEAQDKGKNQNNGA